MTAHDASPRRATVAEAATVAGLLHDFNDEFDTLTPGPAFLTARLTDLLDGDTTFAIVAGVPACGVALVTMRSNVWHVGPVALLDEMYVVPARRGEGIGSAILTAAIDVARSAHCELIEVNVDEGDLGARRFYRRHGFSEIDIEAGERALYLSRTVPT